MNLKELKELADIAAKPPWKYCKDEYGNGLIFDAFNIAIFSTEHELGWPDAEFIAAANPATILKLIEALEIQREALKDGCCCPGEVHWTGPKARQPILCDECEALAKVEEILK